MIRIFEDRPEEGVIYHLSTGIIASHIYLSLPTWQRKHFYFDEGMRCYVENNYRVSKHERRVMSQRGGA